MTLQTGQIKTEIMKRDGLTETSETYDARTVLFPVRMGSTTTTKIEVEWRFPNRQRPGDKVVLYTNSETRDLTL